MGNANEPAFPVVTPNPLIKSDGMSYRQYLIAQIAKGQASHDISPEFGPLIIEAADDVLRHM